MENNLKTGQIFKNYKELCEFLGWKVGTGTQKKSQLKQLNILCEWHKEGNKIIVDEVYEIKKEKEDKRFKKFEGFSIGESHWKDIGIYRIINEDIGELYIGSTTMGFRDRFLQHNNMNTAKKNDMLHTYNLINTQGTRFEIIETMNDATEKEIREREQYWLDYYKDNSDYIIINRKEETYCIKEKKPKEPKPKYINIKVEESIYLEVLEFLKDNNLLDKTIIK